MAPLDPPLFRFEQKGGRLVNGQTGGPYPKEKISYRASLALSRTYVNGSLVPIPASTGTALEDMGEAEHTRFFAQPRIICVVSHYTNVHAVPPLDAVGRAGLPIERRATPRYPLELEGELQLDGRAVSCRSANISSGGLLTTCDREVQVGDPVTVRLDWPLRQRNQQVVLVVQGEVVRRAPGHIGILRRQYTFDVRQCS